MTNNSVIDVKKIANKKRMYGWSSFENALVKGIAGGRQWHKRPLDSGPMVVSTWFDDQNEGSLNVKEFSEHHSYQWVLVTEFLQLG
jgi:hypothetical protein